MEYIIDILKFNDESSRQYLKEVFGFNEGYGMNLDAFNDKLGEMTNIKVKVINADKASEYQKKIINILMINALDNDTLALEIVM